MPLVAAVTVSNYDTVHMHPDELKQYVMSSLTRSISDEIYKYMTIEEINDVISDTTRYTGTLTIGQQNLTNASFGTITTSSIGTNTSVQENLRVVEYIKQGKIIRVELQRYNANIDDWETIPRIKIGE